MLETPRNSLARYASTACSSGNGSAVGRRESVWGGGGLGLGLAEFDFGMSQSTQAVSVRFSAARIKLKLNLHDTWMSCSTQAMSVWLF